MESLAPHTGQVRLQRAGGQKLSTTVATLVNDPECRASTTTSAVLASGRDLQSAGLEDLTDRQREVVALRYAHLMEVETGYRSGSSLRPRPDEPRPVYDPTATSLRERRLAKVAELKGLGEAEAMLLGLGRVSERTLETVGGGAHRPVGDCVCPVLNVWMAIGIGSGASGGWSAQ